MPGLNQRGPMNEGPMTGGGRGLCTGAVASEQEFANRMTGSMGRGLGRGRGCGGGSGRGMGRRRNLNVEPTPTKPQE